MPTTIKEALGMDDGMPVVGLRGTIKTAFDLKEGGEGDRSWRFIPIIVKDDSGNEIRATWFSPTVSSPNEIKGRPVEIGAKKNQRNQLAGAKIQHREYKGKPQIQITVDGEHLRFLDGTTEEAAGASQAAGGDRSKATTYSQVVGAGKGAQAAPVGRPTDVELIAAVGRWAQGLRDALDPVHPEKVPLEVLQPLISTFLIAATSDRSSLTVVPPGRRPEAVRPADPPDTRGENLTDDKLGGALDGFDNEPTEEDWS